MHNSKVSLILTTYNCKENFRTTMESILTQDYPNLEIVVKDGGSQDGTLELVQEYEARFQPVTQPEATRQDSHTNSALPEIGNAPIRTFVWRSAPDTGIYDALNQGIKLSTGDIIAVCNDRFTRSDAISLLVKAIQEKQDSIGVHADLVYADGDRIIRRWHMGQGKIRAGWMPGHPTLYLKRDVYEKYGLYDTSYRCSADFEFMVRVLTDHEEQLAYVPETLISMYYGGTSTGSLKSYLRSINESHTALVRNGVRPAWWIIFRRILKTIHQF